MKRFFLVLLILLIAAAAFLYTKKDILLRDTAKKVLKENLPVYIDFDDLQFDFKEGIIRFKGLKVLNPPGFSSKYLAVAREVGCGYEFKEGSVFKGIHVKNIDVDDVDIFIERKDNAEVNLNELGPMIEEENIKKKAQESAESVPEPQEKKKIPFVKNVELEDYLRIPKNININSGTLYVVDKAVSSPPHNIKVSDISCLLKLVLKDNYAKLTELSADGAGFLNGHADQKISFTTYYNPIPRELNMSNRIKLENVDVTIFQPYYYNFSPIFINKGRVSGDLVMDFDNGNIGSTNTLEFTGLDFTEKQDGIASRFWGGSIQDILKYLRANTGTIIFDFRIKGPVNNPQFYPGPIVKRAFQNMTIDKITDLISGGNDQPETGGDNKTDTEKVMDVIKGFLNK